MNPSQCAVCRRETQSQAALLCRSCQRSYDRMLREKDESIRSVIEWAATRARRYSSKPPMRQPNLLKNLQTHGSWIIDSNGNVRSTWSNDPTIEPALILLVQQGLVTVQSETFLSRPHAEHPHSL